MRLWAGDSFARVWVGDTIFRIDRGRVRVEETVPAVPGALHVSLDEVVAWSPSGERLDSALAVGARCVLDAVALEETRIAAVLADDRGAPWLVVGPPAGPFEIEIELTGPGVEARLPDRLAGPRRAEPLGGPGPRGVRVHASEHGIAVAGASGHVAVVRPGDDAPAFVLRIATHDEARLDAVPTHQGVLVTELLSGRDATVLHLAPDGRLLGRWLGAGSFPAVLVAGDRVLAFDGDAGELALLSLPALTEIARERLDAGQVFEAAVRPQGSSVVLAANRQVYTATIQRASVEIRGPYPLVVAPRPAVAEKKPRSRPMLLVEASGPPEIGFPTEKQGAEPPWKVGVGTELRLPMRVRSTGGPGTGLAVALSGPAIELGLLTGVSMRVDDEEVPLTREGVVFRGVLPGVVLARGLTRPSTLKETAEEQALLAPTHLTVELVVRGAAPGSALLSVAITARDGLGIKRMRPFVVS